MQCSGIHRGLGVHISQVRSTTLDTWQPDQVLKMTQTGNARSNAKYEARLPASFKRPSHAKDGQSAVRRFIEQKYIQRKWYSDSVEEEAPRQASAPKAKRIVEPQRAAPSEARNGSEGDLLPDLLGPDPPNVTDGALEKKPSSIMDELEGLSVGSAAPASNAPLQSKVSGDAWDDFVVASVSSESRSTFAGATPAATSQGVQKPLVERRQSSKDDIMSLYDNSASANPMDSFFNQMQTSRSVPAQAQAPANFSSYGTMQMGGMHSGPFSQQRQQQQRQQQQQQYQGYQSGTNAFDSFL